ncbi:MAG: twitching motility protein PilT [Firmicutes bacterium]|nr:twitching motility protein PilT [Bacillota bacterium]MBQ7241731.1 twitching motility protein PilT [Bacillota bacterium]MBR0104955.1 twitching motility protein PilT [Bacillota bacterium]MBR2593115.1 twitching motility protein PilT [Bacillota bacterium]
MIQIIAGEKGQGKTKRLLDMANEAGKVADGNIVFIDDDKRHMFDLSYNIRFVETSSFIMDDHRMFYGFIRGILSQDSDIEKIFIDGINNIIKKITLEDFLNFIQELEKVSVEYDVDFIMIISIKVEDLPESVKKYLI